MADSFSLCIFICFLLSLIALTSVSTTPAEGGIYLKSIFSDLQIRYSECRILQRNVTVGHHSSWQLQIITVTTVITDIHVYVFTVISMICGICSSVISFLFTLYV